MILRTLVILSVFSFGATAAESASRLKSLVSDRMYEPASSGSTLLGFGVASSRSGSQMQFFPTVELQFRATPKFAFSLLGQFAARNLFKETLPSTPDFGLGYGLNYYSRGTYQGWVVKIQGRTDFVRLDGDRFSTTFVFSPRTGWRWRNPEKEASLAFLVGVDRRFVRSAEWSPAFEASFGFDFDLNSIFY